MDKLLDFIRAEDLDHNISPQQWQTFLSVVKQRRQFYSEENARLETVLMRLKLLNTELKLLSGLSDSLSNISSVLQNLQTNSTNNNTVTLSYTERLRKHSNYVSKLKICIKMYLNLNERLSKEIKFTKWELDQSRNNLGEVMNLSNDEIRQLEEKARKYENELLKFEKKYPWLKDPDFNLPNISKELEMLQGLKDTKEKLCKELSVYQDLKPDLKEAAQQLAQIKEEHKQMQIPNF